VTRNTPSLRIAFTAGVVILALALVPVALAGKGGGGKGGGGGGGGGGSTSSGSGSLTLVLMNSTDGLPHFGQDVTFNVSTTASQPWVHLQCFQNGAMVLEGHYGAYSGYPYWQYFQLGPTGYWTGGAADCTAYLEVYTGSSWAKIGSTSFHVYA